MDEAEAILNLHCRSCDVRGACEYNIKEHLNSKKHKNKLAQMNKANDKQSSSTCEEEQKSHKYVNVIHSTTPHARVRIPKILHRAIVGPHANTIRHLKEKTSCDIEIARFEGQSDEIHLYGTQSQINAAIDELRVIVDTLEMVPCVKSLHSRLIGADGANIKLLTAGTGCIIDFQDDYAIIGGPEGNMSIVKERLKYRMEKLLLLGATNDKKVEKTITVPKAMHAYFVGKGGTTIAYMQSHYNVQIFVPPPVSDSERMIICGDVLCDVENAIEAINRMVSMKMRTKSPDSNIFNHDVPRRLHPFILGRQARTVQWLNKTYGVHIMLPHDPYTTSIAIKGSRDNVSRAIEAIDELVARRGLHHRARSLCVPPQRISSPATCSLSDFTTDTGIEATDFNGHTPVLRTDASTQTNFSHAFYVNDAVKQQEEILSKIKRVCRNNRAILQLLAKEDPSIISFLL